jgi:hypothetical protein
MGSGTKVTARQVQISHLPHVLRAWPFVHAQRVSPLANVSAVRGERCPLCVG